MWILFLVRCVNRWIQNTNRPSSYDDARRSFASDCNCIARWTALCLSNIPLVAHAVSLGYLFVLKLLLISLFPKTKKWPQSESKAVSSRPTETFIDDFLHVAILPKMSRVYFEPCFSWIKSNEACGSWDFHEMLHCVFRNWHHWTVLAFSKFEACKYL